MEEERTGDRNREIKIFKEQDRSGLNGRYGAYIAHAGNNYKSPKGKVAAELSVEDCQAIIADEANKPASKKKVTRKGAKK